MPNLFRRKPIAELMAADHSPGGLQRVLGAGDLVLLAIGAVIGAGIFGAIGTAAAGQLDASGHLVRAGAGPALVFSFRSLRKTRIAATYCLPTLTVLSDANCAIRSRSTCGDRACGLAVLSSNAAPEAVCTQ